MVSHNAHGWFWFKNTVLRIDINNNTLIIALMFLEFIESMDVYSVHSHVLANVRVLKETSASCRAPAGMSSLGVPPSHSCPLQPKVSQLHACCLAHPVLHFFLVQ